MKRLAFLAALALVAAALGYALVVAWRGASPPPPGAEADLRWLVQEFRLDDAQYERIRELHAAYEPVCAEHCVRVRAALDRIATLEREGATGGEAHARALAEWEHVRQVCAEATLAHLEAVAACMDPEQGRRYLELVRPHLAHQNHLQPAGLRP